PPLELARLSRSFSRTATPPRPTLSPYTTLFRSNPGDSVSNSDVNRAALMDTLAEMRVIALKLNIPHSAQFSFVRVQEIGADKYTDRKSTRLNSSHEWRSSAVWCLNEQTSGCYRS